MSYEEFLSKARQLCEPSIHDRKKVDAVAKEILKKTEKAAAKFKLTPEVVLGGSYAKDTWLKGDVDIDLFVRFNPELSKEGLKEHGLKLAEKALKNYPTKMRYSEHPYLEGFVNGIRINIVPCFKVTQGKWLSAADRSPFHTEFIKKHISGDLKSDIRLLKKFSKGTGIYGAEVKIGGFSGYVCEVLVLNYGSFIKTLQAVSSFQPPIVVTISSPNVDVKTVFKSPIIIPDPVDSKRNLGAAISKNKLVIFIQAARNFLQKPRLDYFSPVKDSREELVNLELLNNIIVGLIRHSERSPDILWGQLRRSGQGLARQFKARRFVVMRHTEASDEARESAFLLLLESTSLPSNVVRIGPEIFRQDDVEQFLLKNLNKSKLLCIGEDGRITALQPRIHYNAQSLLRELLAGKIEGSGVAPGLTVEALISQQVYGGSKILDIAKQKPWLMDELKELASTNRIIFNSD
jgi:tRNA nucleotidyltransferase (CCA-adding enzyme)